MLHAIHKNAPPPHALDTALNDLRQVIIQRMQSHFNQQPFDFNTYVESALNANIQETLAKHFPQITTAAEWTVLMLALVPHIQPSFFEAIITEHLPNGGDFPEFGGVKGTSHRGMLRTGETAQFMIGGSAF